jgi:tetratricopeptide (TPR) repeat protein
LSARIDSIPESEKRVLQEAAVVGKVFWADPLRRFLGEVTPALLALERRGLISARSNSSLANHDEYDFKHILVRDVAYASLPKARRARAHAEVGAWIEEIAGDRTEEFEELLAYHYRSAVGGDDADLAWIADDREPIRLKAFGHLVAAGAQARRRFAIAKAVELHEQAIDLASGDDERLRGLEELGDDHESAYHGEDAKRAYVAAIEIARRTGKQTDRARLCSKLVEMMTQSPGAFKRSPDPDEVGPFVSEGLAHSVDEEITAHLQVAYGYVARLYRGSEPFGQGLKPDPVPIGERIEPVEKAREVGARLHNFQLLSVANFALGVLYGMAGRYDAQLDLAMQDLTVVDRLGSRIHQGDAVRRAAVAVMTVAGNYEEGLGLAMRSLELSRDTNPHQVMHGTCPVMMALYDLGRWDEIPPFLEEHIAAFQLDPAVVCDFVRDGPVIGAVVSVKSADLDRALKLASLIQDPMLDAQRATAWQATLEIALGRPDNARRISSGKALEGRSYGPAHARSMLEALIALEEWEELDRFSPLARRHVPGLAILGPCCDRAEGLVARARGDQAAATASLERALAGFEALKAGAEAAATRRLLTIEARGQTG